MPSNYCNADCQLADSWSKTELKVDNVSYIWTINDFDFCMAAGDVLKSPMFSAVTNGDVQWYLAVYPTEKDLNIQNGTEGNGSDSKENVGVFLFLSKLSKQKTVFAKYKISILNEERKEMFFKARSTDVGSFKIDNPEPDKQTDVGWGWNCFHKKNGYFRTVLLSNNKLILSCEVTFSKVHDARITTHHNCKASSSQFYSSKTDLLQDFSTLLKNHQFADVVLCVQGTDFSTHKAILAARSPVFAAMFRHDTEENQLNRVQIDDIDAEVVNEMLCFIYTGECEYSNDLAEGLLAAADKYDLGKLKMICSDILAKTVNVQNAAKILFLSDMHNANELKSKTIAYIVDKFTEVQNSTDWSRILSNPQLMNDICGALHCRSYVLVSTGVRKIFTKMSYFFQFVEKLCSFLPMYCYFGILFCSIISFLVFKFLN